MKKEVTDDWFTARAKRIAIIRSTNLCVRCKRDERARETTHCLGCLDYFNRRYTPVCNGKGRPTVQRLPQEAA